jgi:lysozyme
MSTPTDIISQLTRDEGVRLEPYKDTRGFNTVGIGHNLDANPLPGQTYPLTQAQAMQILGKDVERISMFLQSKLPWIVKLDEARRGVLQNMSFNLGVPGLLEFHHDLADTQAGNYEQAALDMEASAWYKEVGDRAKRLVQQMRTGDWQ